MLKTVANLGTTGQLNYAGTWNASTNTPTLASGVGTKDVYYVVSTAGTTTLDGISSWSVGDWAIFNGTVWERVLGGNTESFVNIFVTGVANIASENVTTSNIGTANITTEVVGTANIANLTANVFTIQGYVLFDSANIAAAGTNQSTATLIAADNVYVTSGTGGVVLPVPVTGREISITNNTNASINVYPSSGTSVENASANTPVVLPAYATLGLAAKSTTNWWSTEPVFNPGTGINIVQSANGTVTWSNSGVTSFNTRTGSVTLTSTDVTTALGYTPGTISSITAGTGLSGGTITTSGTIALSVPVTVSNGGTGATTLSSGSFVIGQGTSALTTGAFGINGSGVFTVQGNAGSAGQVFLSNGSTSINSWSSLKTVGGNTVIGSGDVGTIGVAYGGTGATTLTGYVYGNGTSAMTASTSIPTTALSGTITNAQLSNSSATLGNATITLGGTTTSVGNLTLANANITSGNVASANVTITGGSINVQSTNHLSTTSSTATYGTASLPLQPAGFIQVNLNGTVVKVPYYAV